VFLERERGLCCRHICTLPTAGAMAPT